MQIEDIARWVVETAKAELLLLGSMVAFGFPMSLTFLHGVPLLGMVGIGLLCWGLAKGYDVARETFQALGLWWGGITTLCLWLVTAFGLALALTMLVFILFGALAPLAMWMGMSCGTGRSGRFSRW